MMKSCNTCKHVWDGWPSDDCDNCLAGDPPTRWEQSDDYKPDTNSDRIRSMNDKELADFLLKLTCSRDTPWSIPFAKKFCDNCPPIETTVIETGKTMKFYECDFTDGKCPHGRDIEWWLGEPAEE